MLFGLVLLVQRTYARMLDQSIAGRQLAEGVKVLALTEPDSTRRTKMEKLVDLYDAHADGDLERMKRVTGEQ